MNKELIIKLVENGVLASSVCAGEVALYKAISEGYTNFRAVALWSERVLPYPCGHVRQLLAEFSKNLNIIVANDETYAMLTLADIFPYPPKGADLDD